jgi:cobalt-zinc-cadmium efflux system protein
MAVSNHPHIHYTDLARRASGRLALSLGLTLAFVFIEVYAGWISNSLALITDALHNLTDVVALGLSLFAIRLSLQPANSRKTFGYHRAGILIAMINAATLVVIALGIFYEAYQRFKSPPEIQAPVLIVVGLIALGINGLTAWLIHRDSQHDLNLRSAFVHLMGDVLSTVGAVLAGIIILFTGWNWLDPLVSVFIGILILWNAWGILREAVDILLESTPHDIDLERLVADMTAVEGVLGIHDLHVWSINRGMRTLSAHVVTADIPISSGTGIQSQLSELLAQRYGISHATLQLECADCMPDGLYCDLTYNPRQTAHQVQSN